MANVTRCPTCSLSLLLLRRLLSHSSLLRHPLLLNITLSICEHIPLLQALCSTSIEMLVLLEASSFVLTFRFFTGRSTSSKVTFSSSVCFFGDLKGCPFASRDWPVLLLLPLLLLFLMLFMFGMKCPERPREVERARFLDGSRTSFVSWGFAAIGPPRRLRVGC